MTGPVEPPNPSRGRLMKIVDDGMLPVPTGPGLGITLNPEALAKYGRG